MTRLTRVLLAFGCALDLTACGSSETGAQTDGPGDDTGTVGDVTTPPGPEGIDGEDDPGVIDTPTEVLEQEAATPE